MINKQIYLDNAATTSLKKEVLQAMLPYFKESFGNPASIHKVGREALEAVELARLSIAKSLNCDASEIYFTGSTTEADNLAIFGVLNGIAGKGEIHPPHLIISPLEHHAVLDTAKEMEKKGLIELTILTVDKYGLVNPNDVKKAIKENTRLVSVMYVSNEVGTLEPLEEISSVIATNNSSKPYHVLFHTDAAAAKYLPLDTQKLGVDLMVLGPHKFGGPKGIGILFAKKGIKITPLVYGGGQEKGLRPGTHNVPAIVGAAKALEILVKEGENEGFKVRELANNLIKGLQSRVSDSYLTGHPSQRAPYIVSFIFKGAEGEAMVLRLSDKGIMVSSGSACTSGQLTASHVLLACGIPQEEAHGSVRFSLGKDTTKEDIEYTVEAVREVVEGLRKMNPFWK